MIGMMVQLSALKQELLDDGYQEADEQIRLFNNDRMPLKPGCDPIQVGILFDSHSLIQCKGVSAAV